MSQTRQLYGAKFISMKESVLLGPGYFRSLDMLDGLEVFRNMAPELYHDTMVVTSAGDGDDDDPNSHAKGSLHYVDRAWDIRYLGQRAGGIVTPETDVDAQRGEAWAWARRAKQVLGPEWDIIVESNHIHAELDLLKGGVT